MTIPSQVFDSAIGKWIAETAEPWNRLKYEVAATNLSRHLPSGPLRILDAGGGTGCESIPFAVSGHCVDLIDYSEAMLDTARQSAVAAQVNDRFVTHQADMLHIVDLFEPGTFDVVLCHNVLQYVSDVPGLLRNLAAPLKPGGVLSLISANRYAAPLRAAFMFDNLEEACRLLDEHTETALLFGQTITTYSGDEIAAMLPEADLAFDRYYGIRCLWEYWGDNEKRATVVDQLWRLEFSLTDRHPYNLLARFWQIIAHKR